MIHGQLEVWPAEPHGHLKAKPLHCDPAPYTKVLIYSLQPDTGKTNTDLDLSDPDSNPSVQEQRHRGFGRCYTIHPAEKFRKLGLYYFKIWL